MSKFTQQYSPDYSDIETPSDSSTYIKRSVSMKVKKSEKDEKERKLNDELKNLRKSVAARV